MAPPTTPKPAFPNVPNLPGVPALPRSGDTPPNVQAVLGGIESTLWQAFSQQAIWGIYTAGSETKQSVKDRLLANAPKIGVPGYTFNPKPPVPGLVVQADTVVDFGFHNESNISSFPVQRGSFANYNKVNNPFEVKLRLFKGGNVDERKAFIESIEVAAKSFSLYTVATPEKIYLNANIVGYEMVRRVDEGAFSLAVDITLIEIREITPTYSVTENAQQPDARPPEKQGLTQATPPAPSVMAEIKSVLATTTEKAKELLK